jgi:hypothetical protein
VTLALRARGILFSKRISRTPIRIQQSVFEPDTAKARSAERHAPSLEPRRHEAA